MLHAGCDVRCSGTVLLIYCYCFLEGAQVDYFGDLCFVADVPDYVGQKMAIPWVREGLPLWRGLKDCASLCARSMCLVA